MAGLIVQMNRLNLNNSSKVQSIPSYEGCRSTRCSAGRTSRREKAVVSRRSPLQIQCLRLVNVEIPNDKRVVASLTYIYGIGFSTSRKILDSTGVENKRTYDLSPEDIDKISQELEKYPIEGELRRQKQLDIKRLIDIGCYRGRRHVMKLPVRGQKTKTNARTRKGKRGSPIKGKK